MCTEVGETKAFFSSHACSFPFMCIARSQILPRLSRRDAVCTGHAGSIPATTYRRKKSGESWHGASLSFYLFLILYFSLFFFSLSLSFSSLKLSSSETRSLTAARMAPFSTASDCRPRPLGRQDGAPTHGSVHRGTAAIATGSSQSRRIEKNREKLSENI